MGRKTRKPYMGKLRLPMAPTLSAVSVHGLAGDWSIFRQKTHFADEPLAENMDLSHFRGGQVNSPGNVPRAAKIGTVPCERLPTPLAHSIRREKRSPRSHYLAGFGGLL